MCFRFFSRKGDPNWLLRILNSFWKNEQQSCSCGVCLFSYCGLLENKAELSVVKFKKILFLSRYVEAGLFTILWFLLGGGRKWQGRERLGGGHSEGEAWQIRVTSRDRHQLTLNWANPISFTSSGISDPSQPEAWKGKKKCSVLVGCYWFFLQTCSCDGGSQHRLHGARCRISSRRHPKNHFLQWLLGAN